MSRIFTYLGYAAAWILVVGAIVVLAMSSRAHRDELVVRSLDIAIADSTELGNLVTTNMVLKMLKESKFEVVGSRVRDLPLQQIEESIGSNGFVRGVEAYVDYNGDMRIEVSQRSAMMRLLLNGYNCYITRDGFIFDAPRTTALYTHVVTGGYRPLFKANYVGHIDDYKEQRIAEIELEIERVEREKYPILLRKRENTEDQRAVRKRFINRSGFESKENFARRVAELREENRKLRELYAYRQREIEKELNVLEQRQERYREEQKKVCKKCDDLYNLITFVEMVERDDFWRSEVVQIDLNESGNGDVVVSIAVRSAGFIVKIGELNGDVKELRGKFDRLRNFYNEALPRVGWQRYKEINLEYKNQVVCRR